MCVTPRKAAGVCLPSRLSLVACCGAVPGHGRILGHCGKGACVRVLWGEAVPLSRNRDKCKRALRGFLLPVGQGGACAGACQMGAGVGYVRGPPCSGMCVPRGLWVVAQETVRWQGGWREPGVAGGALFLAAWPHTVGAPLCLPKRPLEGCKH